jgi:hypothetical protein
MNVAQPTVVPIFATPLGVVPLPDADALNPELAALFAARMRVDGQAEPRDPWCYRSSDDLFEWPESPVPQLAAAISRGVKSVINTVNVFNAAQLNSFAMQARAWFTVVSPDGRVPATIYPLTAWCGIYCVAAPPPSATRSDSGLLRLYESRLGTMFADATNATMRIPFTPGHYGWQPVPGQLAVFPGSLTHEIAPVRSPGQLVLVTVRVRFVAPGQLGMTRW